MDIIISGKEETIDLIEWYVPGQTNDNDLWSYWDNVNKKRRRSQEFLTHNYHPSVFNLCVQGINGPIIYNTLYNSLVRLSKGEYQQYCDGQCTSKALLKKFIQNGLFVKEGMNESQRYISVCGKLAQRPSRSLSITITTTLKCNAHCPYCYERGVEQKDMMSGAGDRIVDFIQSKNPNGTVNLVWFGGEPLLNIALIDEVSEKLTQKGIKYIASMITNGSLFSKKLMDEKLSAWHLREVQITLDGPMEVYEKTKCYDHSVDGGFFRILNTIKSLAEHDVSVHIRMNICRTNMVSICELAKELDYVFSNHDNITFYPAFLSGLHEKLSDQEKIDFLGKLFSSVKNLQKIFSGQKLHSVPKTHACNRADSHAFTIDVSGNIFACEHQVGIAEKSLGNINAPEKIVDPRHKTQYLGKKCRACVFLPKCYGGCKADQEAGDAPCFIERYLIPAYLQIL